MDKYLLTFQIKNHPEARKFLSEVTATEETLKSAIFERTKYFSDVYKTPVKCVSSKKIVNKTTSAGMV